MTSETLPRGSMTESNPFQSVVPDSVRTVSPDLYEFLRDLTENLRSTHNQSQAGDSTYNWQLMLQVDAVQTHTPGSLGSFYHPDFGLIRGRYVQFASMQDSRPGQPVSRVAGVRGLPWRVTNNDGQPLGLMIGETVPLSDSFGWVLTEGANINVLYVSEKPVNGKVKGIGEFVGTAEAVVEGWRLPPGTVRVDLEGTSGRLSQNEIEQIGGYVLTRGLKYGTQIEELRQTLELLDGRNKLSLDILSRRVTVLTSDRASIEFTERLNATANFANLAGVEASKAGYAATLTNVQLAATQQIRRDVAVFRDQSGYYASSAIEFSNVATLKANESLVSAEASATYSQSAKVGADQAGVYAEAAEQSALRAEAASGGAANDSYARAEIVKESKARADSDKAITDVQTAQKTEYTQFDSDRKTAITQANARIDQEAQTRSDSDAAITAITTQQRSDFNSRNDNVDASFNRVGAQIDTESRTRADRDAAITQITTDQRSEYTQFNTNQTQAVSQANARIDSESQTRADRDAALTQITTQQRSDFNTRNGQVDGALSQANARIDSESQTRADADGALTQQISNAVADYKYRDSVVQASINQEAQTRSDQYSATTQLITTQRSDYNGLYVQVQTVSQTAADASGRASVYWAVVSDLGGQRAGLELRHVNGQYATFDITANVRIYGNLLVTGTVSTLQLSQGAATGGKVAVRSGLSFRTSPTTVTTLKYTPYDASSGLVLFISGDVTMGLPAPSNAQIRVYLYQNGNQVYGPALVQRVGTFCFIIPGLSGSGEQSFDLLIDSTGSTSTSDPHYIGNGAITLMELKR